MASLDDILTTQKNGVVAVNNLNQTWLRLEGTVTSLTVTSPTLIVPLKGYLVSFSVVVAGTNTGLIYNSNTLGGILAVNALCTIPTTIGVYKCGLVYSSGLVVVPGTGQSINVTYTPG